MDLHYYCIFKPCDQDDPITELNGVPTGRCKLPNVANPQYVPIYQPKNCCPDPINTDPRRNEMYCTSNPSKSLPLSNSEYLRKLIKNGGRPLSNSYLLQTDPSSGIYRTTTWTEAGTSNLVSADDRVDIGVIPRAPPVTGTLGTAIDAGTLTQIRMAIGARGSISALDSNNRRFGSNTTLRRMGLAIASNPSGFGGFEEPCIACDLSGTSASVIAGQFKCTCDSVKYNTVTGPFGMIWNVSEPQSYTSPVLSPDERLLYVCGNQYVYAFETSSGNNMWKFKNPFVNDNFSYSNITVGIDGVVYFGGSFSPYFFAVDGVKGTLKWYYTTGNVNNNFPSKPALGNNTIYTNSTGPNATVYCFSLQGTLLYTFTNLDLTNNTTLQSPTVSQDGKVFIVYSGKLFCLNYDLTYIWDITCGDVNCEYSVNWFSAKIDNNGLIYVGSSSSSLYCFVNEVTHATLKWVRTFPVSGFVLSPVIGSSGQIYVTYNTNTTHTPPDILHNAGSIRRISPVNGSDMYLYNFLSNSPGDLVNWIFPALGPKGRIYITNIIDSSLIILTDSNNTLSLHKNIIDTSADSGVYGSLCLAPPVVGTKGVFWCNGNQQLPCIFATGYPIVIKSYEPNVDVPVYRPPIRPTFVTTVAKIVPIKPQLRLHT